MQSWNGYTEEVSFFSEQETEEKKPYLLLAVSFLNIRSYLLFLMRFLWDQNGESKRGEMTALP